jgi:hypothetical protein
VILLREAKMLPALLPAMRMVLMMVVVTAAAKSKTTAVINRNTGNIRNKADAVLAREI